VTKNKEGFFKFSISDLSCSHIWLHLPMDDRPFGYITKLTKNTVCQTSQEQDEIAMNTTKSGRIVFSDLTDKIGKIQCVASMSPIM